MGKSRSSGEPAAVEPAVTAVRRCRCVATTLRLPCRLASSTRLAPRRQRGDAVEVVRHPYRIAGGHHRTSGGECTYCVAEPRDANPQRQYLAAPAAPV